MLCLFIYDIFIDYTTYVIEISYTSTDCCSMAIIQPARSGQNAFSLLMIPGTISNKHKSVRVLRCSEWVWGKV